MLVGTGMWVVLAAIVCGLGLTACGKQPPARPSIVTFVAKPSTVQRGQSTTLYWKTVNTTAISLNQGIGAAPAQGEHKVYPTSSTTYTLAVEGDGGSATATLRVIVTQPPSP